MNEIEARLLAAAEKLETIYNEREGRLQAWENELIGRLEKLTTQLEASSAANANLRQQLEGFKKDFATRWSELEGQLKRLLDN